MYACIILVIEKSCCTPSFARLLHSSELQSASGCCTAAALRPSSTGRTSLLPSAAVRAGARRISSMPPCSPPHPPIKQQQVVSQLRQLTAPGRSKATN
uniref:Uncharacterized protein n=1 Tax=Arundo donax TaxID=35708 RepID=A0A0A9TXP3_ARUDO